MNLLKKNAKNLIFSSLFLFSSSNVQAETPILDMEMAIILQSAFNRCMLEEKVLTKEQAITMNRGGAAVTPELFNPVIKIIENGATKSQKKGQDIVIDQLGGGKNYIRTFISTTMKEDSEEMMKLLDKQGFNDDLIGRPKSYFDKDLKMVFS